MQSVFAVLLNIRSDPESGTVTNTRLVGRRQCLMAPAYVHHGSAYSSHGFYREDHASLF